MVCRTRVFVLYQYDLLGHTWFHPLMLQGWLVMETPWTLIEMGKEASGHTSETMEI